MPQFDVSTYREQVTWTVRTRSVLYRVLVSEVLPRAVGGMKRRAKKTERRRESAKNRTGGERGEVEASYGRSVGKAATASLGRIQERHAESESKEGGMVPERRAGNEERMAGRIAERVKRESVKKRVTK